MRVLIILTNVLFFVVGCGGGGGSGGNSKSNIDSLIGSYFMSGTHNETGEPVVFAVNISKGNKIETVTFLMVDESHAFYRANRGTFTKNGDSISIEWNYETCDPVGSETVKVNYTDPSDRIFVTIDNSIYQMLNIKKWMPEIDYTNTYFVLTEDVECDKFP